FGVGYLQARLVSILFGLGITLLIIALVRKNFSDSAALVAGILIAFNYYFIMISRTAVIEIPAIFFMLLAVFLLNRSSQHRGYLFTAGVTAFVAIITKLYAFFLLPVIILFFMIRKRYKDLLICLSGIFTAAIVYSFLWCMMTDLHTFEDVIRLNFNIGKMEIMRDNGTLVAVTSEHIQQSIKPEFFFKILRSISGRFIYIHHLFIIAPGIFILCSLYFMQFALKKNSHPIANLELLAIGWILFGGGILSIARYTSFHHLMILLPPMVILSASLITRVFEKLTFHQASVTANSGLNSKSIIFLKRFLAPSFLFILLHQILYTALMVGFQQFIENTPIVNPAEQFNAFAFLWFIFKNEGFNMLPLLPRINAYEFWRSIAACIACAGSILIFIFLKNRLSTIRLLRALCVAGFMIFMILNLWRYVDWYRFPEYSQFKASRNLGKILDGSELIIGGQFLGLENRVHFAHHHEPGELYEEKAEYLIELVYHPLKGPLLPQNLPNRNTDKLFVTDFIVQDHIYHLYRLSVPD
ncbi:phospholipid carrier-dependent glycosyltransferase, partial [candidate division KSB1 bacterium]|nr:phospholipid carrier-dependent glycosyltransferase [candidate division KSB1 bacterium]